MGQTVEKQDVLRYAYMWNKPQGKKFKGTSSISGSICYFPKYKSLVKVLHVKMIYGRWEEEGGGGGQGGEMAQKMNAHMNK